MHFFSLLLYACGISSILAVPTISSFPSSLVLSSSFDPIKAAYWTGLPHHRRTPFSVSPDGKSAYLAYLDSSYSKVWVQQVDVSTFGAVGTAVSVAGFEAAGLVAQNDGFALLVTVTATGTTDLPPNGYPVVALVRFKGGVETWRTMLNGPGVHASDGLTATPDANGDLVYSSASGLYAAYFVVTAYSGSASGHFGDSIQYVNDAGTLQDIASSSTFGCSHNTGIGLEDADAPPFSSICAEDHGAIWLNTDTQYMSGVKIANENVTNGCSGEPMGGMSGSYSNLARFPSTSSYIFAWQSRGAVDLYTDSWMGAPYTQCSPRWLNHNVAVATLASKDTLTGSQATSVVGATDGDSQVNWITESTTEDHQNVHVAAINSQTSLVTWETLTSPTCEAVPLGCSGTYAGTSFQLVDSSGAKVGTPVVSTSVFVSGDIAIVGTDRVCWPYVDTKWDLSAPKSSGTLVTKMSFACASLDGSTVVSSSAAGAATTSSTAAAATTDTQTPVGSSNPAVFTLTSTPVAVVASSSPAAQTSEAASDTEPAATVSEGTASTPVVTATTSIVGVTSSAAVSISSSPTHGRSGHSHQAQHTTLSRVRKVSSKAAVVTVLSHDCNGKDKGMSH